MSFLFCPRFKPHLIFALFLPETLLCASRATRGRMGKSRSSSLLDDPEDEEYEYMNKQPFVVSTSPQHNSVWLRPNKKRTASTSSHMTSYSEDTVPSVDLRGSHHNSDSEQQGSNEVEYEYMDIRGSEKDAPPAYCPPAPPQPPLEQARREKEKEDEEVEEEDEYVEEGYHYTNPQPKLRQALRDTRAPKVRGREEELSYEYEDMDGRATLQPGNTVVYQNVQERAAAGRYGLNTFLKVRAGVGLEDRASGDSSFDNPDYWHSRMMLKTKAVPT